MKKKDWRNPLLLLLTAVIWGVAFVAQSVGMDYVGGFTFNCVRSLIGSAVLVPCIFLLDYLKKGEAGIGGGKETVPGGEKESVGSGPSAALLGKRGVPGAARTAPEDGKAAETGGKTLALGGICCGVILFVASNLQQFGIKYTTVGKAGFITAMYIVLVPLLGVFLKKRAGLRVWASVALAVAGLYLLCITEGFSVGKGDFLVLLCAAAFAVHILVIDYFSPRVDGVRMSCIQFLVCGLLSGVCMLLFEDPGLDAVLAAWMPILYAGVLSCGVAYTLQIIGQKGTDPTVASLILSLESVVSVLAGWAILGQRFSGRELFGCVLMFAAIVLAQLPGKREAENGA